MKRTPLQRKTPLKAKAPMKKSRPKTTKIRQSARGMPCMVRLPGCDGGGETTVLAHYRMSGYCGTAIKPDDFVFGAFACRVCHDYADFRLKLDGMTRDEIRLAHAEGVFRTQAYLIEKGLAPHQTTPHSKE